MALVAFTGVVSAATLNANFDDATATMTTNIAAGTEESTLMFWFASIADVADLSLRSGAWTQPDDAELVSYNVGVTAATGVTLTLTVENGDASFLLDDTFSVNIVYLGAGFTENSPSKALKLLRGVRYRLAVDNGAVGAAAGPIYVSVTLRSTRRRR